MYKAIQTTVRAVFYTSMLLLAVVAPQAIAQAVGASIAY